MAVYLGNKPAGFNNVIIQSNPTVTPLTITAEGTYTAPSGIAYSPITVTVGDKIKPSVIRPDAEQIVTYSGNYLAVEDMAATITQPYDTTSRTILAAGAQFKTTTSDGITMDLNSYDYLILIRALTIPVYNINTVGKGREEYAMFSYIYTYTRLFTNSLPALINNTLYTSTSDTVPGFGVYRSLTWSSATALRLDSTSSYGAIQVVAAPSISSNKLIISSPSVLVRGNTTYLTSTYYNALTDIHVQYKVEVYRSPKHNLPTDGWGPPDEIAKIINCIKNNNAILT